MTSGGGHIFRATAAIQPIGFNVGLQSSAEWIRMYQDTGPYESFYFDNVAGDGTIDPLTGLPTSGNTKLTIQVRPTIRFPTGNYTASWTGGGTIGGQSSPITFLVSAAQGITWNCTGAISNYSLTPAAGAPGTYTPTFQTRAARGEGIRWMSAWRVNEDGGASGASYNPASPWVRERVVTGANTFYHRLIEPTQAAELAAAFNHPSMWICLHHRMDDSTITNIINEITAVYSGTIYVEYSNEIWNPDWPQYSELLQQAIDSNLYTGAPGDPSRLQAYYADRCEQIAQVVKAASSQCRMVIASQTVVPNFYNNWHDWGTLAPFPNIDDVAVSWYFGGQSSRVLDPATALTYTAADLAQLCLDDFGINVAPSLATWKIYADTSGWNLLGYEGGAHTDHGDSAVETHFSSLCQESEMGDVYETILDYWNAQGYGLAMIFEDCGNSSKPWAHHHGELGFTPPRWTAFTDRAR